MWTLLDGFQQLETAELDALLEAPVLITILVGAADGNLDREERRWADHLMQTRTFARPKDLHEFYRIVSDRFLEKVDAAMAAYPEDAAMRGALIAQKLVELNPILAKLEPPLAGDLYKSFLVLARETASASGGFLRIGAVSAVEAQWVDLPMITPVPFKRKPGEDEDLDHYLFTYPPLS